MKKAATALVAMAVLFLSGCGTLYIEGVSSFRGPIINQSLTEPTATPLFWLQGKRVAVTRGNVNYCSPMVVGHTTETWLGIRGARIVKRSDTADYEAVFDADREWSGYYGRITTAGVWLEIIDRAGEVQATSKGESSYWEYQSEAGENSLCEAAARQAVKNLR